MFPSLRSTSWQYLLVLLGWGWVLTAQAQQKKEKDREKPAPPAQTYRLELESNSFEDAHEVHILPDSGVLIVSSKRNSWFGKNDFVLTKYSKELKQVWQSKHEHKSNHDLLFVAAEPKTAYLLFSTLNSKKLVLYQVDNATGAAKASEHTLPSSYITLKEMAALDGQVFLNGLDRSNLNMLHLDPRQEEIDLLPAVFGMEEDLGEFRVDTISRAVEFVVAESNGLRSRVQTKRLNPKGEVIGTYFIQPEIEYRNENTLQGARLTPGDTLSKILLGTFGYRTSVFSKGLFTSNLAGNVKYYDFSKLKHFFEYLSVRGERRMKEKFAKQEARGKPLVLRYRLLLHPVMPHPQGYAIVGEIYYPQYRNSGLNPYYDMTGRYPDIRQNSRRLFDGYRFTHAIACVFDKEGNLLWDNSYKLQNETYNELAPTVEAGVSPEGNITLVYPDEEKIWYKTLKPNSTISNEEKVEVRLADESEKLYASNEEGIVHWYGSNFLAFGFQRIKPAQGEARTVFYLQNMAF
ncbi:hypothetical protein ACD591_16600 [Rufibacter glacialis]|uniref:Uncharacterized protein n=1 Tax=Rufibacter glacialis TaxID=1259555 RepID=A0A5M8QQD8_9BACT|nr:hypothetical protein [Rufibacter glacialis]KAA6437441.1 hypothetical protein FOE74_02760 [Rufibacter glacialis]GGK59272.1 hypothetical protein GCM10011405_04240 [Rufibacter glacialis]